MRAWHSKIFRELFIEKDKEGFWRVYSTKYEEPIGVFMSNDYAMNLVTFIIEAEKFGCNSITTTEDLIYTKEELLYDIEAMQKMYYSKMRAVYEEV